MASPQWSLAAIYCSESIGTLCAVTLANGVVANQVLPTSKGHNLGYGWTSYIYGYSFSLSILAFGGISSYLNPAVALGAWILGDIHTAQFFVILAGTLTGAFFSGLLVYLLYYNQFQVHGVFRRKFETSIADMATTQTVETANLNHDATVTPESSQSQLIYGSYIPSRSGDSEQGLSPSGAVGGFMKPHGQYGTGHPGLRSRGPTVSTGSMELTTGPKVDLTKENPYLTVFATRPAIRSPLINFLSEVFTTAIFVLLINLIHRRGTVSLTSMPSLEPLFSLLESLIDGTILGTVVLSLGGATGGAVNPARDFGPRCAHFLLSLGCHSCSEWGYAWVPVLGPFTGAALAAAIFKGLSSIQPAS